MNSIMEGGLILFGTPNNIHTNTGIEFQTKKNGNNE